VKTVAISPFQVRTLKVGSGMYTADPEKILEAVFVPYQTFGKKRSADSEDETIFFRPSLSQLHWNEELHKRSDAEGFFSSSDVDSK
jgi:hypothetical protein